MRWFPQLLPVLCLALVSCDQSPDRGDTPPPSADPGPGGDSLIKTTVYRHDGSSFQPASVAGSVEYFILYYSASW